LIGNSDMSTPRIIRAAQALLHQVSRIARTLTKQLMGWLLRGLLILGKHPRGSIAGFVLPTTVLLLLVVTLTVGAIGFRTFTRTQQTIGERQQRVIYNAATPAIDRAKAKLEFFFDLNRDPRGGPTPSQDVMLGKMLNDGTNGVSLHSSGTDPYTFTDGNAEERIDINGDGKKDNAWKYRADTNGDGQLDATIAYSIIMTKPPVATPDPLADMTNSATKGIPFRAKKLQVRNAPLSDATRNNACTVAPSASATSQEPNPGWFQDSAANNIIRKNFQVDVYVLPTNADGTPKPNGAVTTLEFQQDRQANQGFRWAAWFRNDLEIFPGPEFNWNGAMHTEGSLIVTGNFRGYMISSKSSCYYTIDASQITSAQVKANQSRGIDKSYQGQFIAGSIRDNNFNGSPTFDVWDGLSNLTTPPPSVTLNDGSDSVKGTPLIPPEYALDPVKLQTEDESVGRNPDIVNPDTPLKYDREAGWENRDLFKKDRMRNLEQPTPYVDDTFRADDRWGPSPRWGPIRERIGGAAGAQISGTHLDALTKLGPPAGQSSEDVGLDGYWERRARREGLRLVVGQRLELGDPAGWGGTSSTALNSADAINVALKEPLRPWMGCASSNSKRCNEARQRKSLWDNLAAVQATAVYHAGYKSNPTSEDLDFPLACIATTVHPGTAGTLDRSATFESLLPSQASGFTMLDANYNPSPTPTVISDFFRGRGTNGWEYEVPSINDFRTSTSPLRVALQNLANFAGDPSGGTPSFQAIADGVHPYPLMSMWGDFSVLRRALQRLNSTTYDNLSPSDKTTLHTAGCTLGMLAHNLDYLEKVPRVGPYPTPTQNVGTLNATMSAPLFQRLVGSSGTGLTNSVTSPTALPNGLREYIRKIDAAIRNTLPDGTPIADNSPLLADVPLAIKNLSAVDMQTMAWSSTGFDNPETYVRLLERWRDTLAATDTARRNQMNDVIALAQLLITREQVARDRLYGFFGAYGPPSAQIFYSNPARDRVSALAPLGECRNWLASNDELGRLCSSRPRYPILYSLFPTRIDEATTAVPVSSIDAGYANAGSPGGFQPHGDLDDRTQYRRVRDEIDEYDLYINDVNTGITYQVVQPSAIDTAPRGLPNASGAILMGGNTRWQLPSAPGADGSTPNSNTLNLIKVCATAPCSQPQTSASRSPALSAPRYQVPFKDAGLFNGRELMSVRTLDLDLDLMRKNSTPAGDFWLPKSGLIYAFREDAVSETHIVRPSENAWGLCSTSTLLQTTEKCQMRTFDNARTGSFDPPLSAAPAPPGISIKPVDFYADPDRRPHGFRLRNGVSIGRTDDDGAGLSFITHNPAYIQGDFNLHRSPTQSSIARADGLEEFISKIDETTPVTFRNSFYARNNTDSNFAVKDRDQWRPSEVIADAVSPLSRNFCDGSIEDSFMAAGNGSLPDVPVRYGCTSSNGRTSYLNQARLTNQPTPVTRVNNTSWMRTNIADSLWPAQVSGTGSPIQGDSPIFIHGSGNPQTISNGFYAGEYQTLDDGRDLISSPAETQMNLIMVSGIVPSRLGQAYGGLHNFPRFLESWGKLYISGAFLQLNYSTYAVAPFDQQNWQSTDLPPTPGAGNNEWIRYYGAPVRRWGYDVGLLKAPPGPVARRFAFSLPTRSEFYSEPAATDPYIQNLCKSVQPAANCP
jgi:hypothetical protein